MGAGHLGVKQISAVNTMGLPQSVQNQGFTPVPELPISAIVCEASQVQRSILSGMLKQVGFNVTTTSTCEETIACLNAQPTDLVVTGIEFDGMSGLDLCRHVKSAPSLAHVYTIIVTASSKKDRVVESLDSGADDFLRKPYDQSELKARLRAASRIVRMQQHLKALADTDPLTGAANRRSFLRRLKDEVARAKRYTSPLAIAVVDLDHFKQINDTFGHAIGDDVIVASVQSFVAGLRTHDLVGRLGGEEFALLMPETTGEMAASVAERLRQSIEEMKIGDGKGGFVPVTASFGIASSAAQDETAERLLQLADEALYEAKNAGRNRVFAEAGDAYA